MWMSSVPLTASIAPGPKMRDLSVISRYRGSRSGFGWLALVHAVVCGHDADDPLAGDLELEHERDIERDGYRARPGRIVPGVCEAEGRAGVARVVERETASDRAHRPAGRRHDRDG